MSSGGESQSSLRQFRRRGARLGVRLAALSAMVTAVAIAATFAVLSVRTRATTRSLITDDVGHGQNAMLTLQRRQDRQFVASAALLATNPSLRSAMATARLEGRPGDPAAGASGHHPDLVRTVRRELERVAPELGSDLVATTDERGRIVAAFVVPDSNGTSHGAPPTGADLSRLAALRHALDPTLDGGPSELYLSVLRVDDSHFHIAAAPIVVDGFTIGTVILGDRLDAAHLRSLVQSFGGDLVITFGGRVIASTLVRRPPGLEGVVSPVDARPRLVRLGDVEYVAASLVMGVADQDVPARLTLLQAVTPTLRRTTRALLMDFVVLGVVAVGLAGAGAALLSRAMIGPLESFVRRLRTAVGAVGTLERIGRLDDDASAAVEIRWLHLSFARLIASLARKRVQLEQRGADLAAANAVLTAEIREREVAEQALRESEAKLSHQAYHDPLTGLANRARFRAEVDRALDRGASAPESIAVLFLDLDNFKNVNDSLGHAVGDRLLIEVSSRLLNATRGCDTVARLGGDEFAVLVDRVRTSSDLITVVERVQRAMRSPISLQGAEVPVGVSIGVARATRDDGAEELLRNADVAMYRAKQLGKGRYELFAPAMHAAVVERMALEADLRRALAEPNGALRLVYQPIVALDTERIAGLEALSRWHHPTRGPMSPDRFIPLAESTGLVVPLGRWVLHAACRHAALWSRESRTTDAGTHLPYVSVNISGRQLEHATLVDDVSAAVTQAGIHPSLLLLEITESVLMQRADAALRTLHELKALGVRLAIDDFGTGYSSLAYLHRFPVDVLKIDKIFIDRFTHGGSDAALGRGIVGLANSLGLQCVAEGIEHAQQAAQLRAAGCGFGQGFYFAKPLGADEAVTVVQAQASGAVPRVAVAG
ncbi:MAG TPA: EAL domain-containing protein [Gemmatimonadaceae bacterium]